MTVKQLIIEREKMLNEVCLDAACSQGCNLPCSECETGKKLSEITELYDQTVWHMYPEEYLKLKGGTAYIVCRVTDDGKKEICIRNWDCKKPWEKQVIYFMCMPCLPA